MTPRSINNSAENTPLPQTEGCSPTAGQEARLAVPSASDREVFGSDAVHGFCELTYQVQSVCR